MSPWVPIGVSLVSTVILALLGWVVRRELGAQAEANRAQNGALQTLRDEHSAQITSLWKELRQWQLDADGKYISRDLFDRLEQARKEAEAERRMSEERLERVLRRLTRRLEGGRGATESDR